MRTSLRRAAIFTAITAASYGLQASISTAPAPLEDRFAESDLVCQCVAIRVDQTNSPSETEGRLAPATYRAAVSIGRAYKGDPPQSGITIDFPSQDPMWGAPLREGYSYLLFLKQTSPNHYAPLQESGAIMPFSRPEKPIEAVGALGIETDIRESLKDQANGTAPRAALDLLLQFRRLSPETVGTLERIAHGPPSDSSLVSQLILCRSSGDPHRYISELISKLIDYQTAVAASPSGLGDDLAGIGDALASAPTIEDIAGLETLSESSIQPLRLSAMLGIRKLSNPGSVPFLIKKLDSNDRLIQYEAVITLAEITGKKGDFGPGMGLFNKSPQRYIDLWKNWYLGRPTFDLPQM